MKGCGADRRQSTEQPSSALLTHRYQLLEGTVSLSLRCPGETWPKLGLSCKGGVQGKGCCPSSRGD